MPSRDSKTLRPYALALALLSPELALACSLAPGFEKHTIVADPADVTAPSAPRIASLKLVQDHDSPLSDSCGDLSSLSIELAAASTDDVSPAEEIGYRFELASGSLPAGLKLPSEPVRVAAFSGSSAQQPRFTFIFGESNQDLRFSLRAHAVDQAGNESAPSAVVEETGERTLAGCSAVGGAPDAGLVAGLVLAAVTLRRARRAGRKGDGILDLVDGPHAEVQPLSRVLGEPARRR